MHQDVVGSQALNTAILVVSQGDFILEPIQHIILIDLTGQQRERERERER